ncbi:MAG: transposase [Actinobacteria bacterium]|nr:transposase [Actinomycetota bacterium]
MAAITDIPISAARTPTDAAVDAAVALHGFRHAIYGCLTSWADALFELSDAVLCAPGPVVSVPTLSLEPTFRRSHGSLYKALVRGSLDADRLRDTLVAHRPADWPAIFAVDASSWPRCDAETSPERGFYYHPSRHSNGQPIVAGWSYQWITQLSWSADSWTAPLDARRIPPTADTTDTTVAQVRDLVARLAAADDRAGPVPMFVFDAGYDPIALTHALTDLRASVVVRIRDDRVFYPDPVAPAPGTVGRPRRHGPRFGCADPTSWPDPDDELTTTDSRYGTVRVLAWHGLHPKLGRRGRWARHEVPPIVRGTVIRVEVEHLPKPTARAKKTLWLWAAGPEPVDLHICWRAYLRRFDIEHTYRFAKNTLGWTTPALRTPEQADRWTWLVVTSYTQLRLARPLVADLRLPWERTREPGKLTPARVRRGFRRLGAIIDTPASPPKSDKPGPGRPQGTRTGPRTRHPAIKKAA